jgi:acetyltransferase EpsM
MGATERIVLWGASGHARVVADILARAGRFTACGYVDEVTPARWGTSFCGQPVLSPDDAKTLFAQGVRAAIIAIGNCAVRLAAAERARALGFTLETAVHPAAVVGADVTLGPGTVLAAGAIVNPGSVLGAHVIINTAASVDHDCRLADGVHVAPGARLAGTVTVGTAAWVGLGALVAENRTIGARTLVGAGSVVVRDLPDDVVAYGNPARVRRPNRR